MIRIARLTLLLTLVPVSACSADAPRPDAREIEVSRIEIPTEGLVPETPDRGGATLEAAWVLRSDDPSFGAFSGMTWNPESGRILAVNDQGAWWSARLERDERGRLQGLAGSKMGTLRDADGDILRRKANADAEAIAWLDAADGRPEGILVSFERNHRVDLYRSFEGLPSGPAQSVGRGFPGLNSNSGLEALATLPDGRVVGLVEEKPKKGSVRGWISDASRQSWEPIRIRASWGHRPTGLDRAPGGGLLLLERMASPLMGFAAKVSWAPDPATVTEGRVPTRALFTVQSPLPVDNFEAIAGASDGEGGVHVLLMSDDNFNGIQRTLLLQFHCARSCYEAPGDAPVQDEDEYESSEGNRSTR